jgi:hypothetical protein
MAHAARKLISTKQAYARCRLPGHDSGNEIVTILKKNPRKDPEKYDQGMLHHGRRRSLTLPWGRKRRRVRGKKKAGLMWDFR